MFAVGVIVIALSTVIYPVLSKLASENNMKGFKNNLSKSINIIIILMVPITIMIMDFSTPIIRILFEEGLFDSHATYLTSTALFYYSIGMLAYGLREILAKGFYSLQDTKTPVKNATISVGINVVFSIVLVKYMGIGGLSLASSISAILTTMLLFISLRKKIGKLGFKNIFITFVKVSIASVIMGVVMKLTYNNILNLGTIFTTESRKIIGVDTIISVFVGVIIYIVLILMFNIKEVREISEIVVNRIRKYIKK